MYKSVEFCKVGIVSEHHEDLEGTGYPSRKTRRDQHPLSRIIQCSNIFLNKVNEIKEDKKPVVVANILDLIESLYGTRIDAECLLALRKIFNVKPREK